MRSVTKTTATCPRCGRTLDVLYSVAHDFPEYGCQTCKQKFVQFCRQEETDGVLTVTYRMKPMGSYDVKVICGKCGKESTAERVDFRGTHLLRGRQKKLRLERYK